MNSTIHPLSPLRCIYVMHTPDARGLLRQVTQVVETLCRAWCGASLTERGGTTEKRGRQPNRMMDSGHHAVRSSTRRRLALWPFSLGAVAIKAFSGRRAGNPLRPLTFKALRALKPLSPLGCTKSNQLINHQGGGI